MRSGLNARVRFLDRVGVRMGTMLTVALLPLGIIAVSQTLRMEEQTARVSETALIGRTEGAAARQRAILQTALGAAEALSEAVSETETTFAACGRLLSDFVSRSGVYAFAGYAALDGELLCSSGTTITNISEGAAYRRFIERRVPSVAANSAGVATGLPVVVVIHPVVTDGELSGMMSLSIPQSYMSDTNGVVSQVDTGELDLFLFDSEGNVLTLGDGMEPLDESSLPAGIDPADLVRRPEAAFHGRSRSGESRVFSVVPVVPGLVYAIGSWQPGDALSGEMMDRRLALAFPLMMWMASLGVAYFAVWRLVIRHVSEMRGQMRRFALGRRDVPPDVLTDAPGEIQEVSQTFHNLARILIRDEAELEASLKEKTVLLKEVHHRVKNNLQLIASIINMQSRNLEEPAARRVLKSVQDRVASIATIHRNLYQAEELAAVQADRLVGDIINQMAVASLPPGSDLKIDIQLEPLTLFPDQAVPLALLATEAFTNAIKYVGSPSDGSPCWVKVTLQSGGEDEAVLEVSNSLGRDSSSDALENSTGLGGQLIEAFAQQLDSDIEHEVTDRAWVMRMRFRIQGFVPA